MFEKLFVASVQIVAVRTVVGSTKSPVGVITSPMVEDYPMSCKHEVRVSSTSRVADRISALSYCCLGRYT